MQVPFYPHVSLGWDASPRNSPTSWGGIIVDNTPTLVRKYLEQAKQYLDQQPPDRRILTINSWNEWTEGSYIEPDTVHGLKYLQAIRDVFGTTHQAPNGK